MSYAILPISAAAYADIRGRLVALDERLKADPSYASEYISAPGILGRPERLVFGPVAFEALPAEEAPPVAELHRRLEELVQSVLALSMVMPDSVLLEHEDAVNRVSAAAERLSAAEIEAIQALTERALRPK